MKIDSYLGEIWVDIIGYEGLYQVSNFGRVKSLGNGRSNNSKEKILKTLNNGHLFVVLWKNGAKNRQYVHILVAIHFIPNPENKPIVHHIDHNPLNNNAENLVWLTKKEHAKEHPERYKKAGKKPKITIQYTNDGEFIKQWNSVAEIQQELGYNNSAIIKCCQGKYKQAYGYKWKYAEDC